MIFRDRIVLPSFGGEPTAIYPEQIKAVALLKPGVSPVPMCRIVKKDNTAYTVTVSGICTDRPTGMVDSTGKEIFERDIDSNGNVVVQAKSGEWMLVNKSGAAFPMMYINTNSITVTGMVPFEEES